MRVLEQRLEEQEELLRRQREELERQKAELATAGKAGATPDPGSFRVFWKDGLRFQTNDAAFELKIGGRINSDWAVLMSGDDDLEAAVGGLEEGAEFRRARLYLEGVLYDRVEFKAQYDFAGGDPAFKDVYLGLIDLPVVGGLRVGQFKEPFSLEEVTSSNYITFMERALLNALVPSRSTGFMTHHHAFDQRLAWAAGVFRDPDDFGDQSGDGEWSFTGRLTGLPWYQDEGRSLLHLGGGYSYRKLNDETIRFSARPEVHLAPRFVDTGSFAADTANLWGGEAALVHGPFSLQGEYVHSAVDATMRANPDFDGYYVQASYFLTGEHRPYKTGEGVFDKVKPKRPFLFRDPGALGAWELALRYSDLDISDAGIRGGEIRDVTVGVNWYLNTNTRVMLNYVNGDPDGVGNADMFQMRFQVFL
jgi:phosphate-selective porin OprO/OprP